MSVFDGDIPLLDGKHIKEVLKYQNTIKKEKIYIFGIIFRCLERIRAEVIISEKYEKKII